MHTCLPGDNVALKYADLMFPYYESTILRWLSNFKNNVLNHLGRSGFDKSAFVWNGRLTEENGICKRMVYIREW